MACIYQLLSYFLNSVTSDWLGLKPVPRPIELHSFLVRFQQVTMRLEPCHSVYSSSWDLSTGRVMTLKSVGYFLYLLSNFLLSAAELFRSPPRRSVIHCRKTWFERPCFCTVQQDGHYDGLLIQFDLDWQLNVTKYSPHWLSLFRPPVFRFADTRHLIRATKRNTTRRCL